MYDLNALLNAGEKIKIGEKVFLLRELSIRERAGLQNTLREYIKLLNDIKDDPQAMLQESRATKDSTDFKIIKQSLDACNPNTPFTEEDFENLTISQVAALEKKILDVNNFFGLTKPINGETAIGFNGTNSSPS